jgi:hypothetical protein
MSIEAFSEWLYATPFATALRETTWAIPNIQAVHILAIAALFGSALVTEMRLAGMVAMDRSVPQVLNRYLPWMRGALVVLLLTGLLLIVAEPGRTLGNTIFWIKMVLVVGAGLVTLRARSILLQSDRATAVAAKPIAWLMIVIWCAVIFCGRFIAYT